MESKIQATDIRKRMVSSKPTGIGKPRINTNQTLNTLRRNQLRNHTNSQVPLSQIRYKLVDKIKSNIELEGLDLSVEMPMKRKRAAWDTKVFIKSLKSIG